jgi:hypothetical protein
MPGIGTSLHVSGIEEMQRKADATRRQFIRSAINGVKKFERIEMREMKKRTPVETGELKDSGFEGEPVVHGDIIEAVMGFTAPHAFVVHEDLEAFHAIGEAKYMESVLNESGPHFLNRVVEDIKKDLGL